MLKHMCRVRLLWAFFWILGLHPGLGMAAETITTEKLRILSSQVRGLMTAALSCTSSRPTVW